MQNAPGGPPSPETRCLICRARKDNWRNWEFWPGAKEEHPRPFAGYFCSSGCAGFWEGLNEEQRFHYVFGSAGAGLDLMRRIEAGEIAVETGGGVWYPQWKELTYTEATEGLDRGRIARSQFTGWISGPEATYAEPGEAAS